MSETFSFEAIGTKWQIKIGENFSTEMKKKILERIDEFDKTYSRFRQDSWIRKSAQKTGKFLLPYDAEPIFALYKKLYELSGGLVTPMIGDLLSDAGYDDKYSFKQKDDLKTPAEWDEVLDFAPPYITFKKNSILDFGALGKGYLIDIVGDLLQKEGINSYAINAGGDILQKNIEGNFVRVGLEDPEDLTKIIGVLKLQNNSLAGSAGNRRKWKGKEGDFHHIINPKSLISPTDILAVWVKAKTAIIADAMSTALFFCDPKTLAKDFDFEYIIMTGDRRVEGTLLSNNMLELY